MSRWTTHLYVVAIVVIGVAYALMQSSPGLFASTRSAGTAPGMQWQAGFSPGNAERVVLDAIANARSTIDIAAYSFTSRHIADALRDAQARGVKIRMVLDRHSNVEADRDGYARSLLDQLAAAGIDVRLVSAFAALHDKFMLVDRDTLETGSFNYTVAASRQNAENALVLRNAPELVDQYRQHWQILFDQGEPMPQE